MNDQPQHENTSNSFEVIVRKEIPFLNKFLFYLLTGCSIILFIIYFLFVSSDRQSTEMKTVYYILVIPEFVKKVLIISIIGLLITYPLYYKLRFYKSANLVLLPDVLNIVGKSINIVLPIKNISKVYCMDEKDRDGFPKGRLTFYFQQKRKESTLRIRLKDYAEVDTLMDQLTKYNQLNFNVYDFDISPTIEED